MIAIEPNTYVFRQLLNSVRGARVLALPFAATDHDGQANLRIPLAPDGAMRAQLGSIKPDWDHAGEEAVMGVPAVRLDSVLPAEWEVSAIKIDVEGHESAVLEGARGILERWRPRLVMEIEQRHLAASETVGDVVGMVCSFGYRCGAITRTAVVPWEQFDVERDQLRWLGGPARSSILNSGDYINNFLFWRDE